MESFEKVIRERNLLQKSAIETLTGQNELQDIIDCLVKAGVPQSEFIEKAKYIRREGAKGNYKYIYEEPKGRTGGKEESPEKKDDTKSTGEKQKYKYWKHQDISSKLEAKKYLDSNDEGFEVRISDGQYMTKENGLYQLHAGGFIMQTDTNFDTVFSRSDAKKEESPEKKDTGFETSTNEFLRKISKTVLEYHDNSKYRIPAKDESEAMNIFAKQNRIPEKDVQKLSHLGVMRFGREDDLITMDFSPKKLKEIKKSSDSDIQKAEQTDTQKAKVAKVMKEFKEGKLKSSSGEIVTDKKQAVAIALSEAGLSEK